MLFNSLDFLLFFIIVVVIYFFLPNKYRWLLLLIASFYFYASINIEYTVLLIISILSIYIASLQIEKTSNIKIKKFYLINCIFLNLGMLILFKYFNFFSQNFSYLGKQLNLSIEIAHLDFLLPIGISFYVFMAISYIVDVYQNKTKAEKNLGIVALYLSFFPHLVAGPIMRANELIPQFYKTYEFEVMRVSDGLKLILWGLFKKVVIADRLALYVDVVYATPTNFDGFSFIIATFFFAIQIYCDFSGYCDIAIGCAQILGYNLSDNFNRPYSSKSIIDFWRRWHISLYTWLRDYIYIPLGGSRVSKPRYFINILAVFLISGLWHGANWTYIVWGLILGIFVIITIITMPISVFLSQRFCKFEKLCEVISIIVTFCMVSFAWIFFRSNSIKDALFIISQIISSLFMGLTSISSLKSIYSSIFLLGTKWFAITGFLLLVLAVIHYIQPHEGIRHMFRDRSAYFRIFFCYFLIMLILFAGELVPRTFIYFQF
jgi:D-alanyl-lipoteichoic acid acyltransferase DltB (MBOAT superfamily)